MEALGALAEYGIYWSPSPSRLGGAISDSGVRPGLAGWDGVDLWDLQECGVWGRLTKPQCGASCGMPNTHHKDHKDSQLRAGRFLPDS